MISVSIGIELAAGVDLIKMFGSTGTDDDVTGFEVRGDLLSVTHIGLHASGRLELQQVDHHHRGVSRARGQRRDLLGGGFQRAAHVSLPVLVRL